MALTQVPDVQISLSQSLLQRLFPPHLELVPQLNEVYELELAFLESKILADQEIFRNGAYFARVGDRLTRHFLICSGEPIRLPKHSSSRLRSFFQTNQFKTGYATHGLFPYRGKFHPQMVKALLNIMGLKEGQTVLDPMMGSGTALIEARLMGIKSIGIDASPFCRFMTEAKIGALTLPTGPIHESLSNSEKVFRYFESLVGAPKRASKQRAKSFDRGLLELMESKAGYVPAQKRSLHPVAGMEDTGVANFLLLAYLDSAGYAERSDRVSSIEQFHAILERYLFVVEKIQRVLEGTQADLAQATVLEGDAREMPFEDESVDGILFSPPYSFAVDYLENDSFHLGVMGANINELRASMIGLRGDSFHEKYELYKSDMERVLVECARVLRQGKLCTIVVGTNNNQLSRMLNIPPEHVVGIDELIVELGASHGLKILKRIGRQISGIANTMRNEFILILQRVN